MTSKLLCAKEVAKILEISEAFAYLMMRRGDLPVVRMGTLVRVRQEDLDQFVIDRITNKSDQPFARTSGWSISDSKHSIGKEAYHV